jgi:hypothetical protein
MWKAAGEGARFPPGCASRQGPPTRRSKIPPLGRGEKHQARGKVSLTVSCARLGPKSVAAIGAHIGIGEKDQAPRASLAAILTASPRGCSDLQSRIPCEAALN